jgi:hypothetical protein
MRQLLAIFFLLIAVPAFAAPESIEGFSFGSSADEIVARIGEPSAIEGPEYQKDSRAWVWSWDYARYGALFEVEAETQDGQKIIRSLTIVPPSSWKLANGLGLGDTSDRILQVYPNVKQYQDTLWFAPHSDRRHVTGFELAGSRIKAIFIGSMKQ